MGIRVLVTYKSLAAGGHRSICDVSGVVVNWTLVIRWEFNARTDSWYVRVWIPLKHLALSTNCLILHNQRLNKYHRHSNFLASDGIDGWVCCAQRVPITDMIRVVAADKHSPQTPVCYCGEVFATCRRLIVPSLLHCTWLWFVDFICARRSFFSRRSRTFRPFAFSSHSYNPIFYEFGSFLIIGMELCILRFTVLAVISAVKCGA